MEKPAAVQYPIHNLLKNRWSPRALSPRPIEDEKLFSLFEAARWSPSGGNQQPWRFVVTKAGSEAYIRFFEALSTNNQQWAGNAAVLVLAVTQRERPSGTINSHAWYDLGQAVANLTIQAQAEGLSVRQMGGFNRDLARDLFGIPAEYDVVTAIAIGYQGNPDDLPEELRQREQQIRTRKSLEELVFLDHWNEPVKIGESLA